jgi:hypothetical protein
MTEKLLDQPDIDPGLQKIGGIAVAKGVDTHPFLYLRQFLQYPAECPWTVCLALGMVAVAPRLRLRLGPDEG